jgi:hypothetical protein
VLNFATQAVPLDPQPGSRSGDDLSRLGKVMGYPFRLGRGEVPELTLDNRGDAALWEEAMERDKQQSIEAKGSTVTDSYAPGVWRSERGASVRVRPDSRSVSPRICGHSVLMPRCLD